MSVPLVLILEKDERGGQRDMPPKPTRYALYLESGPQHRKTMAHVPELLGCVANGPTTEAAIEAAPEAAHAYLRLLHRHRLTVDGKRISPDAPFEVVVADHAIGSGFYGQGALDVIHRDLDPIAEAEIEELLDRFFALTEELATWAETQSDADLDAPPPSGNRTARKVLLHVVGPVAQYVSLPVGGVPGYSALHTAAERGQVGPVEALVRGNAIVADRVRATTPEQRRAVIHHGKEGQRRRTLRSGLRHVLEHHWEHLAELSRWPGGPRL